MVLVLDLKYCLLVRRNRSMDIDRNRSKDTDAGGIDTPQELQAPLLK